MKQFVQSLDKLLNLVEHSLRCLVQAKFLNCHDAGKPGWLLHLGSLSLHMWPCFVARLAAEDAGVFSTVAGASALVLSTTRTVPADSTSSLLALPLFKYFRPNVRGMVRVTHFIPLAEHPPHAFCGKN